MNKPFYYDGRDRRLSEESVEESMAPEGLQITDEMRSMIGRNPFAMEDME